MFCIDSSTRTPLLKALFLFFIFPLAASSQNEDAGAVFNLKGNTRLMSGKATEGVELELKKNGQTISRMVSGKNGKYHIPMNISSTDPKNEYTLHITQAGTIPKSLIINTYIPPDDNDYPFYDYTLEIKMIETTAKDIILEKPSGKIRWDAQSHNFSFDQVFAKVIQKEEPKEDLEKKKREEEDLARKKEEEEMKADLEEARSKADQKAKDEEAARIIQQNLEAMKQSMRKKRMQDSLDSLAAVAARKPVPEVLKVEKVASPEDVDPNAFDGTHAYSINIAMKSQKLYKEKANKEKSKNLSAKYETMNTLTSLLNMVDEADKKEKKQ